MAIARIDDGSETLLDAIPLLDVESIRDMEAVSDSELIKDKSMTQNAIMINTVPGGYNSGRTYYLQAESHDSCEMLARLLRSLAKEARQRAEFNTRFTKSQYRLRKIFRSSILQYFSALLIILVRRKIIEIKFICSST